MTNQLRETLGAFMGITCFQYLQEMAEDTAGRALIVSAGRKYGHDLIETLGLLHSTQEPNAIKEKLGAALGADGSKLCIVNMITAKENGGYEVRVKESACIAGMTASQPHCAFTLGVFIGAMNAITGQQLLGHETECTAMGYPECIYQIEPVG